MGSARSQAAKVRRAGADVIENFKIKTDTGLICDCRKPHAPRTDACKPTVVEAWEPRFLPQMILPSIQVVTLRLSAG